MPRGAPRTAVFRVRLTEAERDHLAATAAAAGKNVAELIRCDAGRLTVRDAATERARVGMLNRINANLNMIAKWVNVHRSTAEAVAVIAHLAAVERAVLRLVERYDR